MKQEEILSTIKSLVKEEIPDASLYLFGSRARGNWHNESEEFHQYDLSLEVVKIKIV